MEPEIFQKYLDNLKKVNKILSYNNDEQKIVIKKEISTLNTLQRGLYAKKFKKRNSFN